jgi:hypothetical protein
MVDDVRQAGRDGTSSVGEAHRILRRKDASAVAIVAGGGLRWVGLTGDTSSEGADMHENNADLKSAVEAAGSFQRSKTTKHQSGCTKRPFVIVGRVG